MNKKGKNIILIIIFVLLIILAFIVFSNIKEKKAASNLEEIAICYEEFQREIKGNSMTPLLDNGQIVTTQENYYDCHFVEREDIIVIAFKTREDDYIKQIRGMPGDKITFQGSNILVNGELLKNSAGDFYVISNLAKKVLSAPLVNDMFIPRNGYLILGDNISSATFDSRQFGYVSQDQFKGRVKI